MVVWRRYCLNVAMWYVYTSSVFCIFQMYCAPFCGNCLENRKKQHIFWLVQSDNIYIYNYITIFNIIIKFNYNITIYNYNYDYIIQLLQYLIQKFTVSYDGNNSTVSIILVIFICFFCCLLEKISVLMLTLLDITFVQNTKCTNTETGKHLKLSLSREGFLYFLCSLF